MCCIPGHDMKSCADAAEKTKTNIRHVVPLSPLIGYGISHYYQVI